MERSWFFGLVFILNGSGTLLSYSSFKESKYAILVAMVLGMMGSTLWMVMARSLSCPDKILATGFQADLLAKAAAISIPFIVFGARCNGKTLLGMGLMVTGALVWS